MKKLLLIEDDPFVIEWIQQLVSDERFVLEVVSSERAFLVRLADLAQEEIFAIIVDLMLPWEDGVPIEATAYPTARGDHFFAGARIIQDLARDTVLRELPILFYTVNDEPKDVAMPNEKLRLTYMRKDEPDDKLMAWVREALRLRLKRPS